MKCLRLVVLVLGYFVIPGTYGSCEYEDTLERGVFHVATDALEIMGTWHGTTLYECMAKCFVNTDNCNSFNYWTDSSRCQYMKGVEDATSKRTGDNVFHATMASLPSEMKDVVGSCSYETCPCTLDRFNRPRCQQMEFNQEPEEIGEDGNDANAATAITQEENK